VPILLPVLCLHYRCPVPFMFNYDMFSYRAPTYLVDIIFDRRILDDNVLYYGDLDITKQRCRCRDDHLLILHHLFVGRAIYYDFQHWPIMWYWLLFDTDTAILRYRVYLVYSKRLTVLLLGCYWPTIYVRILRCLITIRAYVPFCYSIPCLCWAHAYCHIDDRDNIFVVRNWHYWNCSYC